MVSFQDLKRWSQRKVSARLGSSDIWPVYESSCDDLEETLGLNLGWSSLPILADKHIQSWLFVCFLIINCGLLKSNWTFLVYICLFLRNPNNNHNNFPNSRNIGAHPKIPPKIHENFTKTILMIQISWLHNSFTCDIQYFLCFSYDLYVMHSPLE